MNEYRHVKSLLVIGLAILGISLTACGGGEGPPKPPPPAPPEYADKHMPDGYWNNPKSLKRGKLFLPGNRILTSIVPAAMEKMGNRLRLVPGISDGPSRWKCIQMRFGFGV